jgi:ribosomal-protein-alanine N-acetyltransferase
MFDLDATIEFAKPSDAREIAELSREYVEFGLGWRYTPQKVASLLQRQSKNVVVARRGEKLMGFGIMTYRNDSANLDLLAVKRRYRRRGVARQIVTWLVDVAVAAGMHSVFVQVRKINDGAINFYRKLGFYKIEEMPGYYHGEETGVIFCKSLRPVFRATELEQVD